MRWTVPDVVAATGGTVVAGAAGTPGLGEVVFGGVGTDSRRLQPSGLFVPIRAARDGHEFIADAVAAGAAGFLVESGHRAASELPAGVAVAVTDTGAALLDMGRAARRRLTGPVVGITGSVGKTSTKDLLAGVLATTWRVSASEQSFNNELGVPLTLANAAGDSEVTVVEMGARGAGHISLLCDVARPTVAVVTAVAAVHTQLLGSLDQVARAKAELVEALPPQGTAVLNADDARVAAMATGTSAAVVRYSAAGDASADVVAEDIGVGEDLRARFRLRSPWGGAEVRLDARGAHQVGNALAAAAAGLVCGTPLEAVAAGLATAAVSHWRMELVRAPGGAQVINDAYNANPASVAAALRALASLPARRRVAVLGGMAELGPEAPAEHLAVAALAARLGIEVVAVGTPAYGVTPVAGIDEALSALGGLGAGDAVLVKGSRVAGLERLAQRLCEPAG
ncbi:MAG: UDP-N-acetylmuramoyl-tripeptide--D-alanyl-D-alanine ligase [Acidimicrobiales bacterium]